MPPIYADRRQAGRVLAEALKHYAGKPDVLILALPRGGVPVGFEVAETLGAKLDVYPVRKLGVPGHEELAMGAVAAGGVRLLNELVIRQLGISQATIETAAVREEEVLQSQLRKFGGNAPPPVIHGKTVILVDDGLATGSTMAAAIRAVRQQGPARVVVAVPVAPPDTCAEMKRIADEVVCVATPAIFGAVGLWYENFEPVDDHLVRRLLETSRMKIAT
ncbi:MAG TPA: phosphoribosyltransferase family protein [Phycisphaerae bacterium]|nr:phosphoribosyltransferase family protein [Phycisphaerae bacterium]HOJ74384.1 phosphoribosyltransferase family protein [Phycisphaerae bacterium]HOM53008.1 phosphoribosyltransferase family protein [Phycisphaerae bacterium]HON68272.1 phosphoribosyltransferase family protein [Phycisphaerae bacterium]HOQ85778.1 phosphoribosyltransferase family protein [Phycisphaerae bacterium]